MRNDLKPAREVALAWMTEHCQAADGPRMLVEGEPEAGCDCLETLTRLIERERRVGREELADVQLEVYEAAKARLAGGK